MYLATTGETITALQHNSPLTDIAADLNAVRPVTAGGTGANTAAGARTKLGLVIGTDVPAYADRVPSGLIAMWSGAITAIPTGWNLCDGTNSTPDLTNMFIVGAGGTYAVGDTGGEASHTLTEDEMPGHTHTGTTASAGAHTHTIGFAPNNSSDGSGRSNVSTNLTTTTSEDGDHTHTFTTDSTGGDGAHENRPPYYALAFIMKA